MPAGGPVADFARAIARAGVRAAVPLDGMDVDDEAHEDSGVLAVAAAADASDDKESIKSDGDKVLPAVIPRNAHHARALTLPPNRNPAFKRPARDGA